MKTQVQPANDYQWMVKPGLITLSIIIVLGVVIFLAVKAFAPPQGAVSTSLIRQHEADKAAKKVPSSI